MKPILYKAGETDFNHNGIGALSETIACEVTEERNGEFELYLEYPASGLHYAEIQELCLVKAKPNSVDDLHLFRIYERQLDTITQVLSVYATSISNDLGGNLVQSVVSNDVTPQTALDVMKNSLIQPTDFMFHSDINATNSIDWKMRNPLNCIAGEEGSLLDVFGGEIKRGNDFIWLYARRGRNNVATIRHGKNLTGLEAEYSTKGLVTQILPYFTHTPEGSEAEETVIGNLAISQYANNYPVKMILPVDYSSDDRVTDLASLNTAASNYFIENAGIDKPSVAMDVDLDDLSDSSEYEQFKDFENVEVCDTITVYSKQFDVNLTAKVTQIVFDVLREKNQSLKVGSVRTSFYDDLKSGYKDLVKEVTVPLTNTIEKAANGKNRVFRGTDEPLTGMVKNDVWYKPVGDGEIKMHVYDGAFWNEEAYSADSLGGTVNFANINAINLNLNALTTASISGANFWLNLIASIMQFTNPVTGDILVFDQGEIYYQNGTKVRRLRYSEEGFIFEPGEGNTGTSLNTSLILRGGFGSDKYIDFMDKDFETGALSNHQRITARNAIMYFQTIDRVHVVHDSDLSFAPIAASAFEVGSSEDFKQNIMSTEISALDKISSLAVVEYDLNHNVESGIENKQLGFIAENSPYISGSDGKSIDLYKAIALTTKGVQELLARIETLESENAMMKTDIATIKKSLGLA